MKCQFCGKSVSKVYSGPNDIALCEECNKAYEANKIKEEEKPMAEVIEMKPAEVTVEESTTEGVNENPVRCEIVVGVLKDGRLYFNVGGEGADLLVIDGLIKYAERRMKQQWDIRDMELAKAAQEAAEQNGIQGEQPIE